MSQISRISFKQGYHKRVFVTRSMFFNWDHISSSINSMTKYLFPGDAKSLTRSPPRMIEHVSMITVDALGLA